MLFLLIAVHTKVRLKQQGTANDNAVNDNAALMSLNKDETAVRGCNPPVSVLVVWVSCKVYFSRSTISLAVLFAVHTLVCMGPRNQPRSQGPLLR